MPIFRSCRNISRGGEYKWQQILGGVLRSRANRVLIYLVLLFALGLITPANASHSWPVTGRVTDTAGNPLEGVRITDGSDNVWTNSSGDFVIEEPILSSFTLSASKAGYREEFKGEFIHVPCTLPVEQAPCTKPIDFVLKRNDQ